MAALRPPDVRDPSVSSVLVVKDFVSRKRESTWQQRPLVKEENVGSKLFRVLTLLNGRAIPTTDDHNLVAEVGGGVG